MFVENLYYKTIIYVDIPYRLWTECASMGNYWQDRRWNADKPSAALDPYIPTWLTTSPANHRPANFWFFLLNIEMKLWKVVQPQVQLMSINIKFEVPILWLFQVQIITNIIY